MKSVVRTAVVAVAALLTVTGMTTVTSPADDAVSTVIVELTDDCVVCWD
ncbi:hypothetical protein [Kribbella sp. CA-293567]|nr:hypothetical protein [Kribbella sp. CA-293567]WBQ08275.1 hypothetical protein OX958_16040 [Kribbella sp. CA-293567]